MTSIIRRAILAFALIAGLSPAFAQVPPPVPALPDTERRTSYSIIGSTCTCAVGFQLYGDSTDFTSWVEVFVNGVRQSAGWTITSPTGPLGIIPRPITDGVLTFASAQTGTVQIVGARRPRRASQFPENRGVPARDFNVAITDLVAQNRETWDKTNDLAGRVLQGVPGDNFNTFPSAAVRAATILGFDANGNLAYLPLGPTISVTAGSTFNTQGLAQAASISVTVQFVQTAGYAAAGDGGGALYGKAGGTTPCGFQSADGQWWTPDFSRSFNIRVCGAGLGNGTTDVAAMTAASLASGPTSSQSGVDIIIPPGNYDFSTGQFLFTKDGTRILCNDLQTTFIKFNPASPATLFTFFRSGSAQGISNSEMSGCRVSSTNNIQKRILTISNSAGFILRRNLFDGISDAAGGSIGILYQGRNWLTYEDNFVNADLPFFFNTNPDRALAGFEDADFLTGKRNQLASLTTNGAIYTVSTGLNVTNWSVEDEDWAGGRYGVNNQDTTAVATSYVWSFKNVRREQETGSNPTMFVILRSANLLRSFSAENALTNYQLFNFSGVERAHFESPIVFNTPVLVGQADATVSGLSWRKMFSAAGNTIALTGQTLVRGREKKGGTTAAPIYTDATYTNLPEGTIEWIGAPSANGHRVGLWRATADVPVYNGSNAFTLLPWTLYTIQQAEIRVNGPGTSGIATFLIGQTAPAGNTVLIGQTNFAVDAGAGHLSAFHFSDTNVGIVNKLAGSAPVTVEVLFTQQ